jgi:hypothetical protein
MSKWSNQERQWNDFPLIQRFLNLQGEMQSTKCEAWCWKVEVERKWSCFERMCEQECGPYIDRSRGGDRTTRKILDFNDNVIKITETVIS